MKDPITNTQAPKPNMECGGLTPLWISKVLSATKAFWYLKLKAVSSHRTPNALLVIGAYLALGAWLLEII